MATDANRRRLKALGVMEKVKRLDTEEQARTAGALRVRMDAFELQKEQLLARIAGESRIDGIEGAPYLGRFISSIRAELEHIAHQQATLAPELAQAEERLRAALSEQKTYETLQATRLRAERNHKKRREARSQDELSLLRWGR